MSHHGGRRGRYLEAKEKQEDEEEAKEAAEDLAEAQSGSCGLERTVWDASMLLFLDLPTTGRRIVCLVSEAFLVDPLW